MTVKAVTVRPLVVIINKSGYEDQYVSETLVSVATRLSKHGKGLMLILIATLNVNNETHLPEALRPIHARSMNEKRMKKHGVSLLHRQMDALISRGVVFDPHVHFVHSALYVH